VNQDTTFSVSEIRSQRDETERQLALLKRRMDALQRMTDAAEELAALDAENELGPTEAPHSSTPGQASEPKSTGARALCILQAHQNEERLVRMVWDEMVGRGWAQNSKDGRAAVRVALLRLSNRHPEVTRVARGDTHAYMWKPNGNSTVRHDQNGTLTLNL